MPLKIGRPTLHVKFEQNIASADYIHLIRPYIHPCFYYKIAASQNIAEG